MTITKADLSAILVDRLGLNQREAKEMVEIFFKEISTALDSGGTVKLAGFGAFCSRDKPERPGRNPKTGEEIPISARRVVSWHPSARLKSAVDANPHLNLSNKIAA